MGMMELGCMMLLRTTETIGAAVLVPAAVEAVAMVSMLQVAMVPAPAAAAVHCGMKGWLHTF
jgi:hypothetical protein